MNDGNKMMKKAELVFIPTPAIGHIISTVEMAKLLIDRDDRLSITVIIIKMPHELSAITTYINSLFPSSRLRFSHLPVLHFNPMEFDIHLFIDKHKPLVKEVVSDLIQSPDSPRLAGFVLDMFNTCMMDVANEFDVPTYVFFTSGAASLGLSFHVQAQHDEHGLNLMELEAPGTELVVPSYVHPVPSKVLPAMMFEKDGPGFVDVPRKLRPAKGIMVNTFTELESHAIKALSDGTVPKVYPVGPVLNLKGESQKQDDIMAWLDKQPPNSVVFLCFGSLGSFDAEQAREIANGLEQSGHRFLWSLRKPTRDGKFSPPTDYTNLDEVLPEGFLDRTAGMGKVIGWAPQMAVLAHEAVGGFVSHCGWNSVLESIWYGVPIAAWPMYAEQQLNAFELVVELGLAVEIKMDYNKDECQIVSAGEIEKGVRQLMEGGSDMRKKVKEMKEKSRKALMGGGSSYTWMGRFIEDVLHNIS